MINELINKILLDTEKMEEEINNSNLSSSISSVINKILSAETLTDYEIELFKSIINNDDLTVEEKETLEFIQFLISVEDCLDSTQTDLLNNLLTKYKESDTSIINTKVERNRRLINSLQGKEVFADYDYLLDTLKHYNYSSKDILTIIKGLIISNYHSYDKSNIKREDTKNDETSDIVSSVEKATNICDMNYIRKLIKKCGFRQNEFDEKLLYYLPNEDNLFKDVDYILDFFDELKLKPKSIYKIYPLDFVYTLALGTKEHVDEIKRICIERDINMKELIKNGSIVLVSDRTEMIDGEEEPLGLYDNFIKNIEFFDSLNYKYKNNTELNLYYMSNALCKNSYQLYVDEYRFQIKRPNDIDKIFIICLGNCLDRTLELETGRAAMDNPLDYLKVPSKRTYYYFKDIPKNSIKQNSNIPSVMDVVTRAFKRNEDFRYALQNIKIPVLEETEYEKSLYKFFELLLDAEGEEYYCIPLEYVVDHSLEENEYVKYLDENYKKGRFVYVINNETRVSRIKVLRVLNLLNKNNIEITEDAVKFAMKFDLIGYPCDIENINKAFNDFKKGKEKVLC